MNQAAKDSTTNYNMIQTVMITAMVHYMTGSVRRNTMMGTVTATITNPKMIGPNTMIIQITTVHLVGARPLPPNDILNTACEFAASPMSHAA